LTSEVISRRDRSGNPPPEVFLRKIRKKGSLLGRNWLPVTVEPAG
jgi:hypothetical protein